MSQTLLRLQAKDQQRFESAMNEIHAKHITDIYPWSYKLGHDLEKIETLVSLQKAKIAKKLSEANVERLETSILERKSHAKLFEAD